jgi:hypothetical protein
MRKWQHGQVLIVGLLKRVQTKFTLYFSEFCTIAYEF